VLKFEYVYDNLLDPAFVAPGAWVFDRLNDAIVDAATDQSGTERFRRKQDEFCDNG
jgi:hypothetical protein